MSITARFNERFGTEPVGVWAAPGRVNLIGEHTDYNNGFALPFAISQRTHVAAAPRTDGRLRIASDATPETVEVALDELADRLGVGVGSAGDAGSAGAAGSAADPLPEWAAYPLGVAWTLLEAGNPSAQPMGYDLLFTSDVPLGAGLSSSAALLCAAALALNELWALELDPLALARAGQRAENEAVGAPTGIMDEMASLLGRDDHGVLIDCRDLSTQLVPLHFADEQLELLVIDTRVRHAHATGGYGERRASCELGAKLMGVESLRDLSTADLPRAEAGLDPVTLRRVRHILTENDRVQETVARLKASGPRAIGDLLTASHTSLRDDFEVSVPELNLAVELALAEGALGARMTGGGFGGAAIALIDIDRASEVTRALKHGFAAAGFAEPHVFAVTPGPGAHREQ